VCGRDDARRQAVARRVRAGDRLVGTVDDLDRRDRPERLVVREVGVGGDVGKQRRLVTRAGRLAAGEHGRALRHRFVDAAPHELERGFGDQRPDDRVVVAGVPRLEALCLLDQLLHEGIRDRTLHDDPARRHARSALGA